MKNNYPTPNRKELKHFGFITGGIVVALFGVLFPLLKKHSLPAWPWFVAMVLVTCSLFFPNILKPIHRTWITLGNVLGWINTRIIITIMYSLIIVPLALILKIIGKDAMSRKIDKNIKSYRVQATVYPKNHVERPF